MTKKRGTAKRKVTKKNNSEISRKAVFGLIGLFLVFSILSFIGYNDVSLTGHAIDIWQNAGHPETINESTLRWVFFAALSIFIYSVFSTMEFPKGKFTRWLLAIPISYVSIYMISKTDFLSSIYTYGALGLTFITLFPLGAIIFFSSKYLETKLTPSKIILILLAWGGYLIFSVYNFVQYAWVKAGWITLTETGLNEFIKSIGWFPLSVSLFAILIPVIVLLKYEYWTRKFRELGRMLNAEDLKDLAQDQDFGKINIPGSSIGFKKNFG
ncbi:MAG: hypothetical protein V1829_02660 [bacterium]